MVRLPENSCQVIDIKKYDYSFSNLLIYFTYYHALLIRYAERLSGGNNMCSVIICGGQFSQANGAAVLGLAPGCFCYWHRRTWHHLPRAVLVPGSEME